MKSKEIRAHIFLFPTRHPQNFILDLLGEGGGGGDGTPIPPKRPISYIKQPYNKSYIIKGAQSMEGVAAKHVMAPEVDVITDCDALCTAEETEKERERAVTMSAVSVGRKALLPTPFDKTAWLERASGKRADDSEFICCCGPNFGDGSGKDEGKAKTWVVEPNTGKAAPHKHSACPLGPKWDSQKSVTPLGLKAASKSTSSTYSILHQRTPEMLISQPCGVGCGNTPCPTT